MSLIMGFEKFINTNKRTESRITITKSNSFGFPTKFYEENIMDKYNHVVLYWDKVEREIGLHFISDENEKYKFKIIHNKNGYGGQIVATSFFKVNGIDPSVHRKRYDWEKKYVDGIGELYIIKLSPNNNFSAKEN